MRPSFLQREEESLLLFLLLKTGVTAGGKLVAELLNPTGGIHELQLSSVERVAGIADVHRQLRARTSRLKRIPATALYGRFVILGMDAFFHRTALHTVLPNMFTESRILRLPADADKVRVAIRKFAFPAEWPTIAPLT